MDEKRGKEVLMEFSSFMDLAVELELGISGLYNAIAERSGDEPIAARLRTLANEEINHANAIRHGKRYIEEMPDEFDGLTMSFAEAKNGLEKIKALKAALDEAPPSLAGQLRKMLDLEKQFEKIHMGALVKIKDPNLKRMFTSLSKADQSHTLVLLALIESLGEPI